jgi:hypothetical protein
MWTTPEIAKLKRLWDVGMSPAHIALRLPGRTAIAIQGKLQRLGLGYHGFSTIRKSRTLREKIIDVLTEYDGLTTGQIAAKVGCTDNVARRHCKEIPDCVPVNWTHGRAMYGFGKRKPRPKAMTKAEVMRRVHAKKKQINNFWRIAA